MDGEASLREDLTLHLALVGFRSSLRRELGVLVCHAGGHSISVRPGMVLYDDDSKEHR